MDSIFTSFSSGPVIDGHVHFIHPECMDEMLALMSETGCRRFNLVCMPNPDGSTHNSAALAFKRRFPERVYISGALQYLPVLAGPSHTSEILARQVRELKLQGFDGLKLIEGKPMVRKLLPIPLDAPQYAGMWAALEAEAFPIVWHVADPDEFWDGERCPEWARSSGWDYSDGTYPSKEELYHEVEQVLKRHPRLEVIFAHFCFLSSDLERAARFLDAYPNVCFDLAPHLGMFDDFTRSPRAARDFFLSYPDRIVYGTDIDTRVLKRGRQGNQFMRSIAWIIRSTLETPGMFSTSGGPNYHGLGLPAGVLNQIYQRNFERMYGIQPAPLNL